MKLLIKLIVFSCLFQVSEFKKLGSNQIKPVKSKEPLVVETLLYVDYTEYTRWLKFSGGNKDKALKSLKHFYGYSMLRVDEIYKNSKSSELSLTVALSNFYVNTQKSIFGNFSQDVDNDLEVDAYDALTIAKEFYEKSRKYTKKKNLKKFDVVVVVASLEMDSVMGMTDMKEACGETPVVLLTHLSSSQLVTTLAHEIAHILGASHDGEGNNCDPSSLFNMSPSGAYAEHHLVPNSFKFSNCSLQAIKDFVNELNKARNNCLVSGSTRLPLGNVKLPGQFYTLEQQCKLHYGPKSYYCGGGSICKEMLCYRPDQDTCILPHRLSAADGTSCGDKKWCLWDQCVSDPQAPSLNEGLENCHHGDFNGTLKGDKEALCEKVKTNTRMCYKAFNYNKCCETCYKLKGDAGCEYGDREEWCENAIRAHPDFCKLKTTAHTCCHSCPKFYQGEDIGKHDPINTETCSDELFWCQNFKPSLCYSTESFCCASCSIVKKPQATGCEYGDKIEDCSVEMCVTQAEQCCSTCRGL